MGSQAIALGVNPPAQPQGPMDMAAGNLNIQKLINAVQLQKQTQQQAELQTQQEQVKTQLMQQQQQDTNTIRELAPQFSKKDPTTGQGTFDLDGLATAAQARGVNPQTINQLRMQNYEMTTAAAKAGSEKLANEQGHNKAAYEVLEGIKGTTDPDQRQSAYATGLNKLKLLGMDTSHLPPTAPDDKGLEAYETQLGMHGQLLSDAKTLAETNEKNAEAASKDWKEFPALGKLVNTKTNEVKDIAQGALTPPMMESKYVAVQQKKNMGQPLSADESAFAKSYEKFKELVPQFNVNMQTTGGGLGPSPQGPQPPAGGPQPNGAQAQQPKQRTLNDVPGAIRAEVQQVLDYRRADPSITQRGPVGQAINSWVAELDPQHDATTFPARNKILSEYTKNASSGDIGAINTALGHLGELNTAAQALNQNNLPLLHSIAAKLGLATGDDAASTYQMILHRVGPEMTSAYVKGGGGEGERGANQADFDISKGAKQITSNIAESAQLLNSKLDSKRQDWNQTFKPYRDSDQFDNRFITPAAKQVLTSLSANAPTNKGGANANQNTAAPSKPASATHTGIGSVDKKKHWLDKNGADLGVAE